MEKIGKYIFLTNTIGLVGGSQLYISRKVDYLKKNGWEVEVYYTDYDEVVIDNLVEYIPNHLQILSVPFKYISDIQRRGVLNFFSISEQTIIESHLEGLSIWGEYIAKYIRAKHIAYFLCEHFSPLSEDVRAFLKFKLRKNLLYGIQEVSIPLLFKEDFNGNSYKLLAVGCLSNVGGWDSRIAELPIADYNILSLGRLDKPYVPAMVLSIKEFAELYNTKKINLIIIGDSKNRDRILQPLNTINNINVLLMGNMNPIPFNVFTVSDVAIASSGSVRVPAKFDVPTISVDGNDFEAIGVVGYTTSNSLFRDINEPPVKILTMLEDVLLKNMYPKRGEILKEEEIDYTDHQRIIDMDFDEEFYDVEEHCVSKKLSLEYVVTQSLGWKAYLRYMCLKKIIKKIIYARMNKK